MDKNKIQIQISLEDGIRLTRELDDLDTKLMDIRDLFGFGYDKKLFRAGDKVVELLRKFRARLLAELIKAYGMKAVEPKVRPWPTHVSDYLCERHLR